MNELPDPESTPRRSPLWKVTIVIAVVAIAAIAALVVLGKRNRRDAMQRVACEQKLVLIWKMMLIYSNDNRGWLPPNMQAMVRATDMKLETFVCPFTQETPGKTAADADNPAHNSYLYIPFQSIMLMPGTDPVLMHDKPDTHADGGMHFLFADGHAEYYNRSDAAKLLAELTAKNPPVYPVHVPRR